jgi:hypothetical protein
MTGGVNGHSRLALWWNWCDVLKIELQIKRANLTSRMHAKLMREINRHVAEHQAEKRIPLHFQEEAYTRYGARKRGTRYDEYKRKKFGHARPNFRTGNLFRGLRKKITATQYGSRLQLRATLYKKPSEARLAKMTAEQQARHKARNSRRLATWQKREIAILTPGEIREDRKRMAREYKRGAASDQYKRQRRRRIN